MRRALRCELLKARTTRTNLWLLGSCTALVAAVVALHVFSLSAIDLAERENQLTVRGLGTTFGVLFAALLGAISLTGEIRTGLIRPTFLAIPRRRRVIVAKMAVSAAGGAVTGLIAVGIAVGVTAAGLAGRDIPVKTTGPDLAQLLVGAPVAAAAWAALGVGFAALVRNQVGVLVALAVWLLFAENVLIANLPALGKYLPGAAAAALAGASLDQTATYLLDPALGVLLLLGYVATASAAGLLTTARRDFS